MKTDPDPFFICLIFSNFFIFIFELLKKCSLSVPLFNMPKGAKNKILYTFKLINSLLQFDNNKHIWVRIRLPSVYYGSESRRPLSTDPIQIRIKLCEAFKFQNAIFCCLLKQMMFSTGTHYMYLSEAFNFIFLNLEFDIHFVLFLNFVQLKNITKFVVQCVKTDTL